MDYKMLKRYFVFIAMLFHYVHCFSQSESFLRNNNAQNSMISQTLIWDEVSYAQRYDVEIENQKNITWEPYDSYSSEENTIEVHLPAGYYRYRIIVNNVLGRKESPSEWFEFEVFRTVQPSVKAISPKTITINDSTDAHISVEADNIVFNSVFTIKHTDGTILHGALLGNNAGTVLLDFDEHRLKEGEYTFIVENPGGLTDATQTLTVKEERTYDLRFSLGYTASALLPGGSIVPQLETTFLPLGFHGNFEWVPIKKNFGDIGFGLSAHSLIFQQPIDNSIASGRFFPVLLYVSHTYPLIDERLYVSSHVGAGLNFFWNLYFSGGNSVAREELNAIAVLASIGSSLQFYATENLFFALGLDYNSSFFLGDTFLQMVMPSVGMGLKF